MPMKRNLCKFYKTAYLLVYDIGQAIILIFYTTDAYSMINSKLFVYQSLRLAGECNPVMKSSI